MTAEAKPEGTPRVTPANRTAMRRIHRTTSTVVVVVVLGEEEGGVRHVERVESEVHTPEKENEVRRQRGGLPFHSLLLLLLLLRVVHTAVDVNDAKRVRSGRRKN